MEQPNSLHLAQSGNEAASDVQADAPYAAIMNLPCKVPDNGINYQRAYSEGHRDARHAAAELVLAHESALRASHAELVKALESALFIIEHEIADGPTTAESVAARAALDNARKVTQ